jgi:uncharacterized protein (DUF488 family)
VPPDDEGSDPWLQVEAFRAYAAHTRTDEFVAAIHDLSVAVAGRSEQRVAIMCSESLWWRCHRRLIANVMVLLRETAVQHLGHDGKLTDHIPSAGARICAEGLRYDVAEASG